MPFKNVTLWGWGCSSAAEHLSSFCKALGLISSSTKREKKSNAVRFSFLDLNTRALWSNCQKTRHTHTPSWKNHIVKHAHIWTCTNEQIIPILPSFCTKSPSKTDTSLCRARRKNVTKIFQPAPPLLPTRPQHIGAHSRFYARLIQGQFMHHDISAV